MTSPVRRVFAAATLISVLTLLAKLANVAQDLLAAARFGTTDAMDAFLLAYVFPLFAISVATTSITGALIPAYIHARERDGATAAQELASSTVGWITLLLIGVTALLALVIPVALPWFATGFSPAKLALTRHLFFLLLPLVMVSSWGVLWAAVLNAREHFAVTSLAPLATPLGGAIALLFGRIDVFALGIVAGAAVETLIIVIAASRAGVTPVPRLGAFTPELRGIAKQYPSLIAAGVLMTGTTIIDQAMAATLGAGSIAALNYGRKIVGFALTIASLALGTAVFSYVSTLIARRDAAGTRHLLASSAKIVVAITIPAVVVLALGSRPLVALLFERGMFTHADTELVAQVQSGFALQIPFYLLSILGVRVLSALQRNHVLAWIAGVNLIADAVFNYVFMHWFGIAGIALSTSTVYVLSAALVWWRVRVELRNFDTRLNASR